MGLTKIVQLLREHVDSGLGFGLGLDVGASGLLLAWSAANASLPVSGQAVCACAARPEIPAILQAGILQYLAWGIELLP